PKPSRWVCVPNIFRAERPQRGRLREFWQWNVDIIGTPEEANNVADAECIFVAADFFLETGLTPERFVIKINSRALLAAILEHGDVDPSQFKAVYAVLDKRDKLDGAAFGKMVGDLSLTASQRDVLISLGDAKGPEGLETVAGLVAVSFIGMQVRSGRLTMSDLVSGDVPTAPSVQTEVVPTDDSLENRSDKLSDGDGETELDGRLSLGPEHAGSKGFKKASNKDVSRGGDTLSGGPSDGDGEIRLI
ncbi:MAG: ATP phosphoribosyltransferase regulatory subunit, partial [Planctomycetes bacterium]|nr:ATP phosphoribosyltransferase regulatory subunit [Planctomycetota bacterium]